METRRAGESGGDVPDPNRRSISGPWLFLDYAAPVNLTFRNHELSPLSLKKIFKMSNSKFKGS